MRSGVWIPASRSRLRGHARAAAAALFAFAAAGWAGCAREPIRTVVSAEFLDETADGKAEPGETILVRLDRPLPRETAPGSVRVGSDPPLDWTAQIAVGADRRSLEVRIASGTPAFRFKGLYPRDRGATGLWIDLGDGIRQSVDLQLRRSVPALTAVYWIDAAPPGGDGVIGRGDRLRLVFDRPVRLRPEFEGRKVEVPGDLLLRKETIDRLDDGREPAVYRSGAKPEEVEIELGSRPVLTPAPPLPARRPADPGDPEGVSALAINGTDLYPMAKITAAAGGPGVASRGEVEVETESEYPYRPRARDESLPRPGPRSGHTVTPFAGFYAIIAGGRGVESGSPLAQVLLFDPYHQVRGAAPFTEIPPGLPRPVTGHTATLLPGRDRTEGTLDDVIVIAGGESAEGTAGAISVVRLRRGRFVVEPLEESLAVPRADHAAVAVSPDTLLFDGGILRRPGSEESLIVGVAEEIRLELPDPESDTPVRVASHRILRSLPRMRHTLTAVGRDSASGPFILAYGGLGRPAGDLEAAGGEAVRAGAVLGGPPPLDDATLFVPFGAGRVLASPVLIAPGVPERSAVLRPEPFSLALLRWGHTAAALDPGGYPASGAGAAVVLLGGTIRHPIRGFSGDPRLLWDIPLEYLLSLRSPVEPHYALNAVLFRFESADPARSRFEIIQHPSPVPARVPPRLDAAAVSIPGYGVLIAGGRADEPEGRPLRTIEVFLGGGGRLAEFALPLLRPRRGHGAYLVEEEDGTRRAILLGGASGPEGPPGDVEELALPGR